MDRHTRTFEQYCCVMQKNVIMEETGHGSGKKRVCCTGSVTCAQNGGCKNKILCEAMGDMKIQG